MRALEFRLPLIEIYSRGPQGAAATGTSLIPVSIVVVHGDPPIETKCAPLFTSLTGWRRFHELHCRELSVYALMHSADVFSRDHLVSNLWSLPAQGITRVTIDPSCPPDDPQFHSCSIEEAIFKLMMEDLTA